MALTDARKAALMAYCRLDEPTEEEWVLLEGMELAALSYMEDAGVSVPPEGSEREAKFTLCVNALVLDAWDNRGTQTAGYTMADNPAFRRILNQLKATEPVPALGTGNGALGG